jgi:acetoin:2,6-dichlorophenolindophenol oxidoreductase subunit beta
VNYVEHVNALLRHQVTNAGPLIMYGQNVCAGSCLGGLTRGIVSSGQLKVMNTPNTENALMGLGLGLMLRGASAIYAMKQHDFMLLGIDQLAHTSYAMRRRPPEGSFTVLTVVVDSGFEGPQSSLNNLSEIASITRLPCYTITNHDDATLILERHLVQPGVRIIAVSQRLFRTPVIANNDFECATDDASISRYSQGDDVTIACFNFSLPQGLALSTDLQSRGLGADIYSVNAVHAVNYEAILASATRTGKLIVLDDSKSANRTSHHLLLAARDVCDSKNVHYVKRVVDDSLLRPNADVFEVDTDAIRRKFGF